MDGIIRLPTGVVDPTRRQFVPTGGESVPLSEREIALIRYLADRSGAEVSRDALHDELWGRSADPLSRAVDRAIARLRRKLEADPRQPAALLTVQGCGYRLQTATPNTTVDEIAATRPTPSRLLVLGDREVDLGASTVRSPGGTAPLTTAERRTLEVLAATPGLVDSERLARRVGVTGGRTALSNVVYRLRQKIEPEPARPRFIVSVRGEGYRLDAQVRDLRPPLTALAQTLWNVADHVGRVLGLEDCVIYERHDKILRQIAAYGLKAPTRGEILSPISLPMGQGIVGTVAATGRAECVRDVTSDPRYVADAYPGRSELATPILHGGEVVGVLDSESKLLDSYTDTHRAAFESLSAIVAATIADLSHVSRPGRP